MDVVTGRQFGKRAVNPFKICGQVLDVSTVVLQVQSAIVDLAFDGNGDRPALITRAGGVLSWDRGRQ